MPSINHTHEITNFEDNVYKRLNDDAKLRKTKRNDNKGTKTMLTTYESHNRSKKTLNKDNGTKIKNESLRTQSIEINRSNPSRTKKPIHETIERILGDQDDMIENTEEFDNKNDIKESIKLCRKDEIRIP